MPYTTKQQRAVLSCIAAHQDGHVTAQELAEELHSQGESVGLATV